MKNKNYQNDLFTIIKAIMLFMLFMFMLPGITMATGQTFLWIGDGLNEIPGIIRFLIKTSISVIICSYIYFIIKSYSTRCFKIPLILMIVSIVIIPFEVGFINSFNDLSGSGKNESVNSDVIINISSALDNVVHGILVITPVICSIASLVIIGIELYCVVSKKRIKK